MNKKINIKKSTIDDCNFFYNIRNDSKNRKSSFNSKKIKLKDHILWFKKNYNKNFFYTCFYSKKRVGYIRGEEKSEAIIISIAFLKKFQNKNIATTCLKYFEKKLKNNRILIAKVKNNNSKSLNFFYKNDFNLLNKNKSYQNLYKINLIDKNNYLKTIDRIEAIRRGNNVNWMNILRIAFKYSPKDTSKVFKRIFEDDKQINLLSKKLF
jgi:ribosomal protein S18 acetylase RimI-like enzyme